MTPNLLSQAIESANAPPYVPSDEAFKFITFIRASGNEENSSPEAHYKIADALFSADQKDWSVIIECLRGMGKSTVLEYAVIYVAALGYWPNFGKVPFMVFLGASQEGNVKAFFKNVASKIERSPFLRSNVTILRSTDNEIELRNANGVETAVTGRGMSTNWRGIRSKAGDRPSVLIADDILGNDVMTSQAIRETIETNWFSSALPALKPKHKIIYIGTPLSEEDLLHKLKRSGSYSLMHFPLCADFPVPEEEFKSIWPDRFSYEYTLKMFNQFKEAGKSRNFYTEYLLQLTDLSALLVDEEDYRWFDLQLLEKHKHRYNFYIATDFATSMKRNADYSTIGVFAIASNGDWFLVDGQCKRQSMQENLDDLFRYQAKWGVLEVGLETSGQQGGFISILNDMMMSKNIWLRLAKRKGSKDPGIRPVKDKLTRFVTGVQPKFKQGKIWFPQPETVEKYNPLLFGLLTEMLNELGKLTMTGGVEALGHDDAIDLLNQLSEMETFSPGDDGSDPLSRTDTGTTHPGFWGTDITELPDPGFSDYGRNAVF